MLKDYFTIKVTLPAKNYLSTYPIYPFCPEQVSIKKIPANVFKNTLLSSSPDVIKLRRQFAALIAPTSQREEGRDCTRRKSQSGHGVLFMVGGFPSSSLGDETPKTAGLSAKAQLTPEIQPQLLLTIFVQ